MSEHGTLATTKNVKIKLRAQRDSCVRDALQAPDVTATDPEELVTESFLCTGGIHPEVDDITCKGDSGGALFLERKRRLVQVRSGATSLSLWAASPVCVCV
uniref:Peptidase S1 domain-containing protein n=1 Tax=Lepisosteus oculatus TaxID=7918 RepID=W5LVU7_LEPOC